MFAYFLSTSKLNKFGAMHNSLFRFTLTIQSCVRMLCYISLDPPVTAVTEKPKY